MFTWPHNPLAINDMLRALKYSDFFRFLNGLIEDKRGRDFSHVAEGFQVP